MANLTQAFAGGLTPEYMTSLESLITRKFYNESVETVSSGACSVSVRTTLITVSGTRSYTLADGTYEGQQKLFIVTSALSIPVGTLTPANLYDGTSFTLDAAAESVLLEWHATTGWKVVDIQGTSVNA